MANCKICGCPVVAGPVMHSECLEQLVTEAAEQFCGSYCCGPVECISVEKLQETYCANCPMERLMKLGSKDYRRAVRHE